MPINTWRGPCRFCGKMVPKRKGVAEKSTTTGHWLVAHLKCAAKNPAPAPAPKPLHRPEPLVRMPFRDD